MTNMIAFWLLPALLSAIGIVYAEMWEMKYNNDVRPLSAKTLLLGTFVTLVPFLNIVTLVYVAIYFLRYIIPTHITQKRAK